MQVPCSPHCDEAQTRSSQAWEDTLLVFRQPASQLHVWLTELGTVQVPWPQSTSWHGSVVAGGVVQSSPVYPESHSHWPVPASLPVPATHLPCSFVLQLPTEQQLW